jgi:DNA-binding MarR family transcriptional regulator
MIVGSYDEAGMWSEGPIPAALTRFPGYLLARLGQTSTRRFHAALEPHGLHPRHFGVMNIVAAEPGITQHRLHAVTAIDPSSMVAVIDELAQMGLAERRPHPTDRRARAIYLTTAGDAKLAELRQLAGRLHADFFSPLSTSEMKTLHELLRKLATARRQARPRKVDSAA